MAGETPQIIPMSGGRGRGRALRIVALSVLVYTIEWGMVSPLELAGDPQRMAIPWAMLSLSGPLALGVWTWETTGQSGTRLTVMWAALLGTVVYALTGIVGLYVFS
jgi:hypothetical protein